jgi:hypothetical protein
MRQLFVLFIVLLLSLSGCQNNDETFTQNVRTNTLTTDLSTLKAFNDSIFSTRVHTRWSWSRFFIVAGADIAAAATVFTETLDIAAGFVAASGGTGAGVATAAVLICTGVAAAGASCAAYQCTYSIPVPVDTTAMDMLSKEGLIRTEANNFEEALSVMPDSIDLTTNVLTSEQRELVANLHDGLVNGELGRTPLPLTRSIIDEGSPATDPVDAEEGYEIPLFTDAQIVDITLSSNDWIPNYVSTNDYETAFSNMVTSSQLTSNTGSVLTLFFDAMNGYVENSDDMDLVVDEYTNVISQSTTLTIPEKNALLIAFAVAVNSYSLWQSVGVN